MSKYPPKPVICPQHHGVATCFAPDDAVPNADGFIEMHGTCAYHHPVIGLCEPVEKPGTMDLAHYSAQVATAPQVVGGSPGLASNALAHAPVMQPAPVVVEPGTEPEPEPIVEPESPVFTSVSEEPIEGEPAVSSGE